MSSIERLQPRHAAAYRALMLEAYALHPDAFTSSATERAALPLAWWEARLNDQPDALEVVLAVIHDETIMGVVGLAFNQREKARHKVSLFGMYVPDAYQHRGLGRQLVNVALTCASLRPQARLIQLTVSEHNRAAVRLYEQSGFVPFGVEPLAVATGDGFISKVHMWRLLPNA
ncbi:acetyltransferase [Paucimonas lemoignei]|jgi:ribosomal protein S18 acetylase RimI-like enzyme|nr:acetyltransferase [Paucimonas lemoignei]